MKKKILTVLLMATVACMSFTACGNNSNEPETEETGDESTLGDAEKNADEAEDPADATEENQTEDATTEETNTEDTNVDDTNAQETNAEGTEAEGTDDNGSTESVAPEDAAVEDAGTATDTNVETE